MENGIVSKNFHLFFSLAPNFNPNQKQKRIFYFLPNSQSFPLSENLLFPAFSLFPSSHTAFSYFLLSLFAASISACEGLKTSAAPLRLP